MNEFLSKTSAKDLLVIYGEVGARLGLPPQYIEKDLWVCWILHALFELSDWGEHLTFKGGTSLSKAYNLIDRFSEDLDITIHRDALGYAGESSPENAATRTQVKRRLEKLKAECQTCVQKRILPALSQSLSDSLGNKLADRLEVDPADQSAQTILFHYPSVFQRGERYVQHTVRMEFGARSDVWPAEGRDISTYVAKELPGLMADGVFTVRTIAAERTFWEKCMLLHEWTYAIENGKTLRVRQARHYYDLYCLIKGGVAENALTDRQLFMEIREHRRVFFNQSGVDYDQMKPGTLRLAPLSDQVAYWQKDFDAMNEMFFTDPPPFQEVLQAVGEFESKFNIQ